MSIDWDTVLLTKGPKKKQIMVSFKKKDGAQYGSKSNEPCVKVTDVNLATHQFIPDFEGSNAGYIRVYLQLNRDDVALSGTWTAIPLTDNLELGFPTNQATGTYDITIESDPQYIDIPVIILGWDGVSEVTGSLQLTLDNGCEPNYILGVSGTDGVVDDPTPDDDDDDGGGGEPIDPVINPPPECEPQDCSAWDNALVDTTVNTSGLITVRDATDPTFSSNIVNDYSLWLGTGGTTPNQTSVGWRALNVDGTPSDIVSIIGNKPNQSFGSGYAPVQEVIGLNNPCVTNPNVWPSENYRIAPARYYENIQGAPTDQMNTMTVELSQNYATGRAGWPFYGENDYTTTQSISDFVFLTGSNAGGTLVYNISALFAFTSCTAEIPPTDGNTAPYDIHVINSGGDAAIRFRQTTSGSTGKVAIERFNGSQYAPVIDDSFLSMGDFLNIKNTLVTRIYWDTSQVNAPDNYLRAPWSLITTFHNMSTGAQRSLSYSAVEVTGKNSARSYCIPMHPTCVLESGILCGYANAGSGVSCWRVAYAGNSTSSSLIERSISNYTPPDYCERIP